MSEESATAEFIERIEKLGPLYRKYRLAILCVKKADEWLLLHASVILTGSVFPEAPNPPIPEEFLYLVEERSIDTLHALLAQVEQDGIIAIQDATIRIPRKESPRWWNLSFKRNQMAWIPGGGVILRYEGQSLSTVLRELEFSPDAVLKMFHRRPYENLDEFGQVVIGTSLHGSRIVNVDIIAPAWTSIKSASLNGPMLEVRFKCPATILKDIELVATLEGHEFPAREIDLIESSLQTTTSSDEPEMKDCFIAVDTGLEVQSITGGVSITVAVSHKSGILLDYIKAPLQQREYEDNPNKVTRQHFERAFELAKECLPGIREKQDKVVPKVGVVIVKEGQVISEAYRSQTGSGDHAEYIALEKRGLDSTKFQNADLITTLEPCTKRGHGKGKLPCAEWIIRRGIRKVWIAILDRNFDIRGIGEIMLQDAGIAIGRFPDDLAKKALDLNFDHFRTIQDKPTIPLEELHRILGNLKTEVQSHFESLLPVVDEYYTRHKGEFFDKSWITRLLWSKEKREKAKKSWQDLQRGWLTINVLKDLKSEFDMAEIIESSYWCRLGNLLLQAHEVRLTGASFYTETTFDLVYQGRDRWEISRESSYDRTGQPVGDSSLESWMKLRKFPLGLSWTAYSTAIRLDSHNHEAWLGKAKVELLKRRFIESHSSLTRVIQIRSFDVSGAFVTAEETIGFDVASTFHWLARLIEYRHPTAIYADLMPIELHRIQLDAVFGHVKITHSVDKVIDLLVLLLKRPIAFDSAEETTIWRSLGNLLVEIGHKDLRKACQARLSILVEKEQASDKGDHESPLEGNHNNSDEAE